MEYRTTHEYARSLDRKDDLKQFRGKFYLPRNRDGKPLIYLCGNSLGLQPKNVRAYIEQELEDWKNLGVEGHFHARHPWMPYHEFLTAQMAEIVGGLSHEVVVMNSLTVNLHLLMVSFYRPTPGRSKILVEYNPFPSDMYAVKSQIAFHGFDPDDSLIELKPDKGEIVSMDNIRSVLEKEGNQIALILIGGVNYYSGQLYDIKNITRLGHQHGCVVGFDLAHGAGNVKLRLHDDGPDFATWCSYKYLNSGPGGMSGIFVHERHAKDRTIPKFAGWWGHNKSTRFLMGPIFDPIPGAESWQLSNPPILPMAALMASLDIFREAGIDALVQKSRKLTGYLEYLLGAIDSERMKIITPSDPEQRGCQLSIQVAQADKTLFEKITSAGVIADWREPDVIRVAPVPLYNTFEDVWSFSQILKSLLNG